jgi:hypothetical protein
MANGFGSSGNPYVEFPFDRVIEVHWKKNGNGGGPPGGTITFSSAGATFTLPGEEGLKGGENIFNVSISGDIIATEGGAVIGIPTGTSWSINASIYAEVTSGSPPGASMSAFFVIVDATTSAVYAELGPAVATVDGGPVTAEFSTGGGFPGAPVSIAPRFRASLDGGDVVFGFARNFPGTVTITVT